jgi:hypothetical protein
LVRWIGSKNDFLFGQGEGVERAYARAATYFDNACQLKEEIGCKNKASALDLQKKSNR